MSRLLLLSSNPQSFAPITKIFKFSSNEIALNSTNLFVIPFQSSSDILCIFYNQILVLSSIDMTVKDEILLEEQISEFKFIPSESSLTIKLAMNSNANNQISMITTITSRKCSWSVECPNYIVTLTFTEGLTNCRSLPTNPETYIYKQINEVIKDDYIATIYQVNNQHQNNHNQLRILTKSDRSLISSIDLKQDQAIFARSLIWSDKDILIFSISFEKGLRVLKCPFVYFSTSTNGCNLPLIAWCQQQIYVHRAGAICPTWFKLNNSEIWDVLDSQVGPVNDVCVALDGSCLLVTGEKGVAFCDFLIRNWRILPFPKLIHPKWIGSDHVVALTPDNQQLILISRNYFQSMPSSADIINIPIDFPERIKFIDTYNNWQILIQTKEKISILAFDSSKIEFKLVESFNCFLEENDSYGIMKRNNNDRTNHTCYEINSNAVNNLKQAAYFQNKLFVLDKFGNLRIILKESESSLTIFKDCESFLVFSTGHLFFFTNNGIADDGIDNDCSAFLYKEDLITPIRGIKTRSTLALLPFLNCLTVISTDDLNFCLNTQIQSQFLLPDLFLAEADPKILIEWSEDPLYPLALEYVLLRALEKPKLNYLEIIDEIHKTDKKFVLLMSRALVGLIRKIEVHEASQLFKFLPNFSPSKVTEILLNSKSSFEESFNFLPYLAKSYFESHNDRKDSIKSILSFLFRNRTFYNRIPKLKEYLSAFADLQDLFQFTIDSKIKELCKSGRIVKAFELIKESGNEIINLRDLNENELDYENQNNPVLCTMRVDFCTLDKHDDFRIWLRTHNLSKTIQLLDQAQNVANNTELL